MVEVDHRGLRINLYTAHVSEFLPCLKKLMHYKFGLCEKCLHYLF